VPLPRNCQGFMCLDRLEKLKVFYQKDKKKKKKKKVFKLFHKKKNKDKESVKFHFMVKSSFISIISQKNKKKITNPLNFK
jgi:hypothetical protein